jgi:DNA ligase (NAD+)
VVVEKGGEIIPKIVRVDIAQRPTNSEPFTYITHCPECGTTLVRDEGEAKHYCPNDTNCPPQILGKIEHFISRKAMNIMAGEATVELLYNKGLIKNAAYLYQLKKEDIQYFDNWGEKSAENLVNSIAESVQVPYAKVLYALGIRYVGETTAKKIAEALPSIDALAGATEEQLLSIDEVGERIAKSIIAYFADERHCRLVEALRQAGVQMVAQAKEQMSDALSGKTFVITGTLSRPRDEFKALIEQHGGTVSSAVSSQTHYLLAGDKGGSKLQKAEKLGVKIIGEEEFKQLLIFND